MKKSQLNPIPSGVFGTMAKLIRLTEKEGVEWPDWQYLTNNVTARRNLAEYLKMGCPKMGDNDEMAINQLPEGYELTCLILGDDFITPSEMKKVCGFNYTDKQLEHFADTLPGSEMLVSFRDTGKILIAGPAEESDLLQVQELNKEILHLKSGGKYTGGDTIPAGQWLAISKKEVPLSFSRKWKQQQELIAEVEYVPNAAEVSYALAAYYMVRGIRLLRGKYVRTSSIYAYDKQHAYVGDFAGGWFGVYSHGDNLYSFWDDSCDNHLGILSAQRIES